MRRLTLIGVCPAVMVAFAAVSVASASAAVTEPALVECAPAKTETVTFQKKPTKPPEMRTVNTGEYKSAKKCLQGVKYTKDKYRHYGPNPGPEGAYEQVELTHTAAFTGTGEGANLNIPAAGGGVSCLGASFTGKFTGPKSASDIVATFTRCVLNSKECKSAGQSAGTIVTDPLIAGAGYLAGKGTGTPKVGTDLSPESGVKLAEFTCIGGGVHSGSPAIAVTGSVIGEVSPVNTFTNTATFTFKQGAIGKNEWERFQEWPEGETDLLTAHVCQLNEEDAGCPEPITEGFSDEAAQEGTFTGHLSNGGEELEVKA